MGILIKIRNKIKKVNEKGVSTFLTGRAYYLNFSVMLKLMSNINMSKYRNWFAEGSTAPD